MGGLEGCVGGGTLTEERRVAQAYVVEVREALDPSRGLGMTWLLRVGWLGDG